MLTFALQKTNLEVINNLEDYETGDGLALSLGMFDGVHRGHQSIIEALKTTAANKNLIPAALTFWPHPRLIFQPDQPLHLLNTIEEKTVLLEKFGIEKLFVKDFDEKFRNLTGEEFVKEILVKKLNVKYLIVGYDHVFGKNRSGNFELLQKMASEMGFEVQQMEAVDLHNDHISSTKIRNLIAKGQILEANEMLGYAYQLSGKVVHGRQIGRTIGYPTANIDYDPVKCLPKKGGYIVEVLINEKIFRGMLSIGTNPTVNGQKLTAEVYILDFEKDIYGEHITVNFRYFLHNEIKFESLEKLTEKLDEDKRLTENFKF